MLRDDGEEDATARERRAEREQLRELELLARLLRERSKITGRVDAARDPSSDDFDGAN